MKLLNPETRQHLSSRLARIEGQVRGVQKMLREERQCDEIVQQLASIRSAVHGAMINFLQEQAYDCIYEEQSGERHVQVELMTDLITLLGKVS